MDFNYPGSPGVREARVEVADTKAASLKADSLIEVDEDVEDIDTTAVL